jgi:rubredoxin
MSRNKGRTKATSPAPAQAVQSAPTQTTGLSYVTPTEFVELPSRGHFYSSDHPLHNQETIELRFMTAKDEDILTSQALLKNGLAIDRLVSNLIVDKNINPDDLLIGDKNALLLAARVSGYGADYPVQVTCPSCNATQTHTFDLSAFENNEGIQPDENSTSGVTATDNGTFTAVLPRTEYTAEFRLFTAQDEKSAMQTAAKKTKHKLADSASTDLLKVLVVSVNGITDRTEVNNFIDNMPAQDARHIRACVQVVTPNVDMTQSCECPSCGAVADVEVPFTAEFFWPKQ